LCRGNCSPDDRSRTGAVHRPDLQSIRERFDELTEQLLGQLRCTQATHRLASLCRCIQGVRIHWPPCTISTHGRALDLATKWACSADLSREGLPSRREERPVMSPSTSTVRLTCVALGRRANGWPIGHHEELSKLLDTAQVVNVCRWAS
jgi:hypothetical protein